MEQRRLRLGDILDDYCPRERRVTNHAVVAMVGEKVQQTRCTTCDAEHVYKGAKEPRRRSRKDSPEGLFREVLAGMPDGESPQTAIPVTAAVAAREDERSMDERSMDERSMDDAQAADSVPVRARVDEQVIEIVPVVEPAPVEESKDDPGGAADDGPFHRRLIRAQLPRTEGQKDTWQEPDLSFRANANGTRSPALFRSPRGHGGGPSTGRGGGPNVNGGNRPHGRRFAGDGGQGTPGGRGPGGPGRGPSGPGRGPSGRGGRPGFGGPSNGSGRGPSNGPPRGGPRKRSR